MAQYGTGGGAWTPTPTSAYKSYQIPGYTYGYATSPAKLIQQNLAYTAPKTTPVTQPYVPPKVTQPQTPSYTGGGYTPSPIGQPPTMQAYQPFDWRSLIPQAPAAPQVTAQMIADWLSRATGEAGQMYDPQVAGIGRELETSLLASEQSKGAIPGYYQDIIEAVKEWQKTTTEEEQRRWYARGLGQGGGLIEAEKGISESALKETTKAETEKARLLTEITQQEELLKKQAGAKGTEIEAARSQYITSRSAELRETYERNQAEISQQQFQNKMQIAQFGFTAETQNFQNYLQQAELANATWYNNQLLSLQQQSMATGEQARQEQLSWEKQQFGTLSAYEKASLAQAGGAGGAGEMTEYQKATLAENKRQFDIQTAWEKELERLRGIPNKTTEDVLAEKIATQALKDMGYTATGGSTMALPGAVKSTGTFVPQGTTSPTFKMPMNWSNIFKSGF